MPPKIKESHLKRLTINEWPEDERPREKLIKVGAENLTSAELLAILISTGTHRFSAVDLGKELLNRFKTLENLANASPKELTEINGIGSAKAVTLQAAFQLSRNMQKELAERKLKYFKKPSDVADVFMPKLGHLEKEVFAVALLDSAGRYMQSEVITVGTLNASLVHPREIFKVAIRQSAASVILVHNHPSGKLDPSKEDLTVTQQLIESGKMLEIPVQDHLIVSGDKFLSLKEEGYI